MATRLIAAAPFSSPANIRAREIGARVLLNMEKAVFLFPMKPGWRAVHLFMGMKIGPQIHEGILRKRLPGETIV